MGPFSPRQSEPLAALPPLSRPRSVKLTRALSGGGLPSSSGLRPLRRVPLETRAQTRQAFFCLRPCDDD